MLQINLERNISDMKLSELRDLTGVKHLQQVKHHRNMLITKGLLSKQEQAKQAFGQTDILGGKSQLINIPIMGAVNAGVASVYAEGKVEDYLRISSEKLPVRHKKTLYALRVVGNSMDKACIGPNKLNIENGDYVIADGDQYTPQSGDYVISLINGLANVKKLIIDSNEGQVVLVSESSGDYPPIILDIDDQMDYMAQSKVLHVIKVGAVAGV
ncbi:MAG: S24 family peptidase [Candidatus Saccharibacteria bacterium]|nr:S24 family peptidase [Candidatus Saccharibacteria bacterium]